LSLDDMFTRFDVTDTKTDRQTDRHRMTA